MTFYLIYYICYQAPSSAYRTFQNSTGLVLEAVNKLINTIPQDREMLHIHSTGLRPIFPISRQTLPPYESGLYFRHR